MGKSNSKTEQSGDNNINIIEHLEQNENSHENHELKLWIILVVVILQLILVLRKILEKRWKRKGYEMGRAASKANIADV